MQSCQTVTTEGRAYMQNLCFHLWPSLVLPLQNSALLPGSMAAQAEHRAV